jgi:HK97 family phage portal protein
MSLFDKIITNSKTFSNKVTLEVTKAVNDMEKKWIRISGPETGTINTSGEFQTGMKDEGKGTDAYSKIIDVYGCVYLISNSIAQLPLKIYKDVKNTKTGKIEKQEVTNHPAYELIKKPNFKDSIYDIKEAISSNLELTGNAYLLTTREGETIKSIYCLQSRKCKPIKKDLEPGKTIKSLEDMIEGYSYGGDGKKAYEVKDVIHEMKYNPDDDFEGLSPIRAGALSIDTINEARTQNYNIFKNGMRVDGAISTDQTLSETSYKRLLLDFEAKYKGTNNAHRPMILEQGLKYAGIALSQKDLEFILGLKMTREEICGFLFQVPIILLGVLENASYNNIAEATKIFYNMSVIPRLVKNQELWNKFLEQYNTPECYIEYDLSNVEALKENITAKIDNYIKLVQNGRIPPNMAAQLVGLNLENIPQGDKVYIQFSMIEQGTEPVEDEGEEPEEGKRIKSIKKLTPELKEIKWKVFAELTGRIERKYKTAMVTYFEKQLNQVNQEANA